MNIKNKNLAIAALFVVIALISFFLADTIASVEHHQNEFSYLKQKQNEVMALSAAATTGSVVITAMPQDVGNPVATTLSNLNYFFLVALCAVILEKYLITITGLLAFKVLIPVGCVLLAINVKLKKFAIKNIAIKLIAFALIAFLLVPTSVLVSQTIEKTFDYSIEDVGEILEDISEEDADSTQNNTTVVPENTAREEETNKGLWGSIVSALSNGLKKVADSAEVAVDAVSDAVSNAANAVGSSVSKTIEKATTLLNRLIEKLAVIIVTSCLIPLLILLFFKWLASNMLGFTIQMPPMPIPRRFNQPPMPDDTLKLEEGNKPE